MACWLGRAVVQTWGSPATGSKSPGHLDERIDAFLTGFETTLKKLPRDDFEDNREALIAQKLQKDRSLLDESDRHWEQIEHHRSDNTLPNGLACRKSLWGLCIILRKATWRELGFRKED